MARPLPGARCEPRPGDAPSARSLKSTAMSPAIRSRRPSTCASPHNSNPPYASAAALASAQTINITRFASYLVDDLSPPLPTEQLRKANLSPRRPLVSVHMAVVLVQTRKPYTITKQRERWTEEEHNRFLEALKLYGRAWQRIEGLWT
ncbi:hypothetical protein BHE74_00008778 [Ensete ventricosum]|nr:hypothetical protein GW17_00046896 [Ensete ventricosum]RWW82741.1 hypothetical protein BHE74_00008778 [Ensete ventricosum]